METSPGYNVHGPRPWTSFKDTPPSPLLVLRRKEGAKYRAPPAPLPLQGAGEPGTRRQSSKQRAPAPPVRSTSLKDSEDEDEKIVNISKIEASPKVTIDLEETTDSSHSYKNEVSIFVFPENETKEVERKLNNGEDSQDGVCGPEIILNVSKLQKSLDDAMENFGDAVNDMKEKNNNVKVNQAIEKTSKSSREIGRRLAIKGWEKFVEGILSRSSSLICTNLQTLYIGLNSHSLIHIQCG